MRVRRGIKEGSRAARDKGRRRLQPFGKIGNIGRIEPDGLHSGLSPRPIIPRLIYTLFAVRRYSARSAPDLLAPRRSQFAAESSRWIFRFQGSRVELLLGDRRE